MEPPSTLPEKRVRKRSKRLSETDSVTGETEPVRKRSKRGSDVSGKRLEEVEGRRRRGSRDSKSASSKVVAEIVCVYMCMCECVSICVCVCACLHINHCCIHIIIS